MGAVVIVPLMIIVVSLLFGAKPGPTFNGAIKTAVGFTALNSLVGVLFGALGEAITTLGTRYSIAYEVLDIGWVTQTAMGWSIPFAVPLTLVFFLLNWLFLFLGVFKTLNVDFNNNWIIATYIYAIQLTTGNTILAFAAGLIFWFLSIKMADYIAPWIQPYYKMPVKGLTITHYYTTWWAPIGFVMDKLWDSIPVIRDIKWDPKEIRDKFGVFGDNIFVGWLVGTLIGLFAYCSWPLTLAAIGQALTLGFSTSCFMYLVPHAASLIIGGLGPLSETLRKFVTKRMPDKEFYVGLDVAVLVGAPEHSAVGVIAAPIAILISLILPFNRVLPMGDLTAFIFSLVFITNTNKGNVFRGLLNAMILYIPVNLWMTGAMTEINMLMMSKLGYAAPEGAGLVCSLCLGNLPVMWAFLIICQEVCGVATNSLIWAILTIVAFCGSWFFMRNRGEEFAKELEEANAAGLRD